MQMISLQMIHTTLALVLTFSWLIILQTFHTRYYSLGGQDNFRRFFLIKSGCKHKIEQITALRGPLPTYASVFINSLYNKEKLRDQR